MSESHGKVIWSELNTRKPAEAADFFEKVLGLACVETPNPNGGIYRTLKRGEEMVAGILDISGPAFEGAADGWLTYLGCDDVDAACEAAKSAGGDVLSPPMEIPGIGKMAVIKDPGNAVVALMKPSG